ncbi:MAG: hypothetical protein FWF54_00285 [Candidatus Azobacteroides sp.]|nr:hypothetical protein [Candidatus Azobacteroides sp.]
MTSQIEIPKLNSLRLFTQADPVPCEIDGYKYVRKFLHTDKPALQILASLDGAVHWYSSVILDEYGGYVRNVPYTREYRKDSELVIFNFQADLKNLQGMYRICIKLFEYSGKGVKAITSEWFCVHRRNDFKNILIKAANGKNGLGVIFDTGIYFTFRVEGGFYPNSLSVDSDDTAYKDQDVDFVQLHSIPYDVYKLNIGGRRGIPNGLISQINRAFSCDTVLIDDVQFSKTEGAKFEAVESENYPYRSWAIEVTESQNTNADISEFGRIFDYTFDKTFN